MTDVRLVPIEQGVDTFDQLHLVYGATVKLVIHLDMGAHGRGGFQCFIYLGWA